MFSRFKWLFTGIGGAIIAVVFSSYISPSGQEKLRPDCEVTTTQTISGNGNTQQIVNENNCSDKER